MIIAVFLFGLIVSIKLLKREYSKDLVKNK